MRTAMKQEMGKRKIIRKEIGNGNLEIFQMVRRKNRKNKLKKTRENTTIQQAAM